MPYWAACAICGADAHTHIKAAAQPERIKVEIFLNVEELFMNIAVENEISDIGKRLRILTS